MINAVHSILFARDADAARGFFADVLGLHSVDAGGGCLIFATPPAELAVHPAEGEPRHELYLMTDDLDATLEAPRGRAGGLRRGPPRRRRLVPARPGGGPRPGRAPVPARHDDPGDDVGDARRL